MDFLGIGSQIVGFLIVLVVIIAWAIVCWLRELAVDQQAELYRDEIKYLRLKIAGHQLYERGLEEDEPNDPYEAEDEEDDPWDYDSLTGEDYELPIR